MPVRPTHEPPKASPSTRSGEVRHPKHDEPDERRAQRFAEAHAWVLEHHAETFRKLAK